MSQQDQPKNIILILDRSRSMWGKNWWHLRLAAKHFAERCIACGGSVAVIEFPTGYAYPLFHPHWDWPWKARVRTSFTTSRWRVKRATFRRLAWGGTPLHDALDKATKLTLRRSKRNWPALGVLCTDGCPSKIQLAIDGAKKFKDAGNRLAVIGLFGKSFMWHDPYGHMPDGNLLDDRDRFNVMKALASQHSLHPVNKPELFASSLDQLLVEVFA